MCIFLLLHLNVKLWLYIIHLNSVTDNLCDKLLLKYNFTQQLFVVFLNKKIVTPVAPVLTQMYYIK